MPTSIVSGRVDSGIRDRAAAYIRGAGLTTGDVIRRVWESIAQTGEIPPEASTQEDAPVSEAFQEFLRFCDTKPQVDNEWIARMPDAAVHDVARDHLLDKYA